jgi:hypothetical protein
MPIFDNPELSPREHILMENERDENRLLREHAETIKRLEIELQREKDQAEIELRRLEAKWSSWLSLPKTVIKLPVYVLLGFGYIVLCIRKQKPTEAFWRFLNK